MKLLELNRLFKNEEEKSSKIAEICDLNTKYYDFYDDLNKIHKAEILFIDLLIEENHWSQISEAMGFSKGVNIGHWPAEASERADAFLLTMFKFVAKKREFVKEKFQKFHDVLTEILK